MNMAEVAERAVKRIRDKFQCPEVPIEYEMALNMGAALGQAQRTTHFNGRVDYKIRLNPHLMLRGGEKESIETLEHEIAHVYDHVVYGCWGHGPTWRNLMTVLDYANPRPCHTVAVAGFRGRRERATAWCKSCGKTSGVTLKQKARLTLGKSIKASCVFCKGELKATLE